MENLIHPSTLIPTHIFTSYTQHFYLNFNHFKKLEIFLDGTLNRSSKLKIAESETPNLHVSARDL